MLAPPSAIRPAPGIVTRTPTIETMSPRVAEWLRRNPAARVLSVFEHACNLIDERGEIVALVAPQVGCGPFHAVLSEPLPFSALTEARSTVRIEAGRILADRFDIEFDGAGLWNPVLDWGGRRADLHHIERRARHLAASLPHIRAAVARHSDLGRWGTMPDDVHAWQTTRAAESLSLAVANADLEACASAAAELAGLGPGSTPSGDDHLLGAIYAAWLLHPAPAAQAVASSIADVAAPRTTSLSAAWLKAARRGECGELWHDLIAALAGVDDAALRSAANRILQTGATSGEEALTAFLDVFTAHVALERTT